VTIVHSIIIKKNQAFKFCAEKKCINAWNIERDEGEEWLVLTPGAYLPQIVEVLVENVNAHILSLELMRYQNV
jgi:hypothetical protein